MKSDIGRIEQEWNSYLKHCVPKNASPLQIHISRSSFYAGALSMRTVIVEVLKSTFKDESALRIELEMIQTEFKAFIAEGCGEGEIS